MRKHRKFAAVLGLIAVTVLASTPVLSESGARNLFIAQDSYLNGKDIPRGDYRLTWKKNGSEDTVKLSLFRGVELVATAEGRMVEANEDRDGDTVVYKIEDNGKRVIIGVRFGGKDQAIEISS